MPDISVNRTTYIKIGSASPITTGIAEGSMLINRVLFAEDFKFGQFASSRFEIQIYGISNVAGQNIEVYQLENSVRTDLFVGQIESSRLDNAGYYRDIIAYDKFYFIAKKNVADWFNGLWTNRTEISVLDAYKSLLEHFDIDYDPNTVTAANFSGTLKKDSIVEFEKISFKDMVKYLLEPLALIPYINASGQGAVYSPSMANNIDLYPLVDGVRQTRYDTNQSVFEEYEVQPMQWVGIANVDSAILQQAEITGNTSDIRYDLSYNPIRLDLYVEDGETARTSVLNNFTSKANFSTYTPCEVFMVVSDMSIKLGDKITTTRGTAYISEIILSGPMLVEQQLISRGSQVQQEVEEEYNPVFAYLDNRITATAEDLQEQLDDFQPSDEYLEKVSEFSDTIAGGMGLQVITHKNQEDGSVLKYFYAPPPANSAVTGISGSNFIFTMKSSGFAWTNKWEGAADASSESHVDPATGDTVSTQWTSGISKDGNALLKILNAYKVSADILEGGELVIKDSSGNIIHKFSYDDYSALMGGPNGISYNASTGKTTIGSDVDILGTVTIGGSATIGDTITNAVDAAVDDLNLRGIDHLEYRYAITENSYPIPQASAWQLKFPSNLSSHKGEYLWTKTITVYDDGGDDASYQATYIGNDGAAGKNGADGKSGKDGSDGSSSYIHIRYSANSNGYQMTTTPNKYIGVRVDTSPTASTDYTKYTWSKFEGTDGAQGTPGTNGKDGTSEYIHFAYSTVGQGETHTDLNSRVSWFPGAAYLGIYHDDQVDDPENWSVYEWSKIQGEKGDDGSQLDHQEVYYAISSNGQTAPAIDTQPESAPRYPAINKSTQWYYCSDTSATSSFLNSISTQSNWNSYKNYLGNQITEVPWTSSRPYLYSFTRTDTTNGQYTLSNWTTVGTYGTGGSASNICSDTWYYASQNTSDIPPSSVSQFNSTYNNGTSTVLSPNGTDVLFDSSYPRILKLTRVIYTDGSINHQSSSLYVALNNSTYNNTIEEDHYLASNYDSTNIIANLATINIGWFTTYKTYHGRHWFQPTWNSTYRYLYKVTRTTNNTGSTLSNPVLVADYNSSGSVTPVTTNWTSTVPDVTQHKGQYLWTRTDVYYTGVVNPTRTYVVTYIATDGDGVGIDHQTVEYAVGTSGTNEPTGSNAWQGTVPSVPQGQYLWTRTTTYYTDDPNNDLGTAKVAYSVAGQGVNGTNGSNGQNGVDGRGISSIKQYYCATSSDQQSSLPIKPGDSNWSNIWDAYWKEQPSACPVAYRFSETNKYLWSFVKTTYTTSPYTSEGTPYIVGVWGKSGSGGGTAGRGISEIIPQYCLHTSDSTAPALTEPPWQDTIPEYPTIQSPTGSGTIASNIAATTVLTGLNLIKNTTYTITVELASTPTYTVYIGLYNANGTELTTNTISTSATSRTFNYNPSSNYEKCYLVLSKRDGAITYSATVNGSNLSVRYYYWQRDKIVWDNGDSPNYTTAIPMSGFNATIYHMNRLNPCFAEVYLNGLTQIYMDAGHLYANSVTAYSVTAYEAIVKNLMANHVEVDGSIDVQHGDITITTVDTSQITTARRDALVELIGLSSWSSLSAEEKLLIAQLINSKFMNRSVYNGSTRCSFVTDQGLYFTTYKNGELLVSRISMYGTGIVGDVTIDGNLSVTGNVTINGTLTVNGRVIS